MIRILQNLTRNQGAHTKIPISTEHMNDNHKRGLTLFLDSFTFQELNSIFHKHGTAFGTLQKLYNCHSVLFECCSWDG